MRKGRGVENEGRGDGDQSHSILICLSPKDLKTSPRSSFSFQMNLLQAHSETGSMRITYPTTTREFLKRTHHHH